MQALDGFQHLDSHSLGRVFDLLSGVTSDSDALNDAHKQAKIAVTNHKKGRKLLCYCVARGLGIEAWAQFHNLKSWLLAVLVAVM